MTEKSLEERIKFLTELLKLLWFTVIALGGGIVGLLLKLDNFLKVLFVLVGILLEVSLLIAIFKVTTDIKRLLQVLDKFNTKGEER